MYLPDDRIPAPILTALHIMDMFKNSDSTIQERPKDEEALRKNSVMLLNRYMLGEQAYRYIDDEDDENDEDNSQPAPVPASK